MSDIPNYTLRISERARRISLRYSAEAGLELIIPSLRHKRKGIEFLKTQQAWIEKKQAQYFATVVNQDFSFPSNLILPAIKQCWNLSYHTATTASLLKDEQSNTLLVHALENSFMSARRLLLDFVQELAELYLKPRLDELSQLSGLDYKAVRFGSHKSQWGSCSKTGNISLNTQLLFLNQGLLDYVLIHELCHTRHFNHSLHFWSLVEKFIPDYREKRKALRFGKRFVPAWVFGNGD